MFGDGTALHGLLYDQPFTVEHESSSSIELKHEYKGYDPGFPFHYTCRVKYTLHEQGRLQVQTTITNDGESEMPIADGWHPYFKLGGKVNEWELQFPAKAKLAFDQRLIPTGELLPFNRFNQPSPIGDTEMDNCFLLDDSLGRPACTLRNLSNGLKISLLPDASYPYLQVFIPGHRESIAIENLSSPPDSFNNKMALLVLQPGQSTSFTVFYTASVEEKS
jgi:aldose 1-epimerase